MQKLNFEKAFELTLDNGEKKQFRAGLQSVPEELADHWFVQAHVAPDDDADSENGEGATDGKAALIAMADELGLKVDGRWSEEKIAAAIEEAEANKAGTGEGA